MRKLVHWTAIAAAIALAAGSLANKAHALTATIRLDNSPNGGSISNTETASIITVQVRFCGSPYNWVTVGTPRALTTVSGTHDFTWTETETTTSGHVTGIRVLTNGSDWFWLDQIEMIAAQGYTEWYDGGDNMNGWCISTQNSDGDNSICWPNNWPANDTSDPSVTWSVQSHTCGWQ